MKNLNVDELNNLIVFGKKIAKVVYLLILILGLYAIINLIKELKIVEFVLTILGIVAPLFIGIIMAWLFDPFVKMLEKKKIKRIYGAIITYAVFVGIMVLLISLVIPALSSQIDEFARTLPNVYGSVETWVDSVFEGLGSIDGFDQEAIKAEMFTGLEAWATELPKTLPTITINIIKAFFDGLAVFVVGLVIGFYLLINFDNAGDAFLTLMPKSAKQDFSVLGTELNKSLRGFVQGTLMLSFVIFIVSYIGFAAIGLKGALLFAMFCGITNIIPIIGPYIGGFPAIIVGFSQSLTVGILVFIVIFVVQFLEGNFFHPILLSKTMKLHPVTIILGLLVFGYYWGIIGMILATPVISVFKTIFRFLDTKFAILKFNG